MEACRHLRQVVDFYAGGGNSNPYLDKEIKTIHLRGQERSDLVEFLKSLTGEIPPNVGPPEKQIGAHTHNETLSPLPLRLYRISLALSQDVRRNRRRAVRKATPQPQRIFKVDPATAASINGNVHYTGASQPRSGSI